MTPATVSRPMCTPTTCAESCACRGNCPSASSMSTAPAASWCRASTRAGSIPASAARTASTVSTDTCGSRPPTSAGDASRPLKTAAQHPEQDPGKGPKTSIPWRNTMLRRTFLALATGVAAMSLGLAGASAQELPKLKQKEKYKVGFAQTESNNPLRIAQTESMKAEAAKLGHQLVYTDAAGSAAKQVADVNSMIAQGVDLIFLAPREEKPLIPAVMAAKRAGIPVVLLDRNVDQSLAKAGRDYVTFIGSDFVDEGKRAAEALTKAVNGTAIYAHNDEMAIGAIAALEAAGKKPGKDVIVVSIDGTRDALQAIIDGKMLATVECNPKFGPKAFETMARYAKGEQIEPWVVNTDRFFDKSNASQLIADAY